MWSCSSSFRKKFSLKLREPWCSSTALPLVGIITLIEHSADLTALTTSTLILGNKATVMHSVEEFGPGDFTR